MPVVSEAKEYPNIENFSLSDAVLHIIFFPEFLQLFKSTFWGTIKKLFPCSILTTFSSCCKRIYVLYES